MPDLSVVTANLHNDVGPTRWLRTRSKQGSVGHYDVATVSEANRRRRMLSGFPGHRYLTGRRPGPEQETGILMPKARPDLGSTDAFLSPEAEHFGGVGNERWGQVAYSEIRNTRFGVISLHPVAGPKALSGNDPNNQLVKRYAMAMRWLEATLDYLDAVNHEAIVGSDIQMMENWDTMWSPHHIFEERKMTYFWHRIDVIAVSKGLAIRSSTAVDIGSDHPALRAGVDVK